MIRGGAIGDFILTLPAIAALRRQFPEAHIELLGYPHIAQLAVAGGLVDQVEHIEARAMAGFFARNGSLAPGLADYFSSFNLILSYLYDPDEIFKANVGLCSRAQFIAAPHRPDERGDLHATRVYLKPLERLAIFDADPIPRLRIGGAESAGPRQLALHPGSGSERKNWPEASWGELICRLLAETDFNLLIVGGEAEGDRLRRLTALLTPERTKVAQSLPLAELAALLAQCGGFVGHDSGITHLAAALGLRGVILWGETPPGVWRPPSETMRLVCAPKGLSRLPVAQVMDQILQHIS